MHKATADIFVAIVRYHNLE